MEEELQLGSVLEAGKAHKVRWLTGVGVEGSQKGQGRQRMVRVSFISCFLSNFSSK